MKKIISLCLVLVLATAMFTGCSNTKKANDTQTPTGAAPSGTAATEAPEATQAAEPVTIEFWTISLQPTFTDFLNGLIKDYETANPNVTVNWTDLPYDAIQQKLVAAAAGGTSPDVVNLNTQMALTLAGKGALVDLAKEATDEQRSIYSESLFSSAQIGDSVYAFPWYATPSVMIYNKALFDKAGITDLPADFVGSFDMAKTMKDKTGAYLYYPPELYYLLLQNDIPILNDDRTAAAFNTSATSTLLQSFKEMTDADYLPKSNWGKWDSELKLFETGKLAVVNASGASIARIKDEAPDIYENIGIATPITGSTGMSVNPLMNVVVPEKSKNHQEAIKFAAYITNDACQLAFCKQVAIFPSTKAASEDEYFVSDTSTLEGLARKIEAETSSTSRDYALGVESQQDVQTAVDKIYEAVITNGADIQSTLSAQEKAVNTILQK